MLAGWQQGVATVVCTAMMLLLLLLLLAGPSLMPGGSAEAYKYIEDIVAKVAAQVNNRRNGCGVAIQPFAKWLWLPVMGAGVVLSNGHQRAAGAAEGASHGNLHDALYVPVVTLLTAVMSG